MEISVVIPVYNEEKNIREKLSALNETLKKSFKSYEIIAVNDGSCDRSLEALRELGFIRLITYGENRGKGYAVRRGVLFARGDYVFFTDADLSYSPENFLTAVNRLKREKSDYIIGIRADKKASYPPMRYFLSEAFSRAVSRALRLSASDTQCGFKGFEKRAARAVFPPLGTRRFGFDFELLYIADRLSLKKSSMSVSFTHSARTHVRLVRDSADMLASLLKLKFRSVYFEKHRPKN